ncbi:TlpA disulfide reductase family protein [Singulisphaera rosea]
MINPRGKRLGILLGVLAVAFLMGLGLARRISRRTGPPDLRSEGAFRFPQSRAKVLCNDPSLRVSCWNDASTLYLQTIVWDDKGDAPGATGDGRPVGNRATFSLEVQSKGRAPSLRHLYYSLNPWPDMPGLYRWLRLGRRSAGLTTDTGGRGSIRYVRALGAKEPVRVDSVLIPLSELEAKTGDTVWLSYRGDTPSRSKSVTCSVGPSSGEADGDRPTDAYQGFVLSDTAERLNRDSFPDGRKDPAMPTANAFTPLPAVGGRPPTISAEAWLNVDRPLRLEDLRGDVVLVEFWASWCKPCLEVIPRLNALHEAYAAKGLRILALTAQGQGQVKQFLERAPIEFAIGTGSRSAGAYGVEGIPHYFLIDRGGMLIWQGTEVDRNLESRVAGALGLESASGKVIKSGVGDETSVGAGVFGDADALLIDLEARGQSAVAANLAGQLSRATRELAHDSPRPGGQVVFGRVVVDGPDDPRVVSSPVRVLDGGYFVTVLTPKSPPLRFQLRGYEPVDVRPKGLLGSIEDLGLVELKPLARGGEARP